MSLEDFFTLAEMKDGLTSLSRVEELVNVMQKEKDCAVNAIDAIRQWTAVATTIAKTESKDCLDLFVKLGGLHFIDKWLKDAEGLGGNAEASCVEEPITAFLLALEKLCIDKGSAIPPGVSVTLNNLFGHSSLRVQDRAREVFNQFKLGGRDTVSDSFVNTELVNDGNETNLGRGRSEPEALVQVEKQSVDNCASEPVRAEKMPSQIPNGIQPERAESIQSDSQDRELQNDMEAEGQSSEFPPSGETCKDDVAVVDKGNTCQENLIVAEALAATDADEQGGAPSSVDASVKEITAVSSLETKVDVDDESNLCSGAADIGFKKTAKDSDHNPNTAENSSGNEAPDNMESSLSKEKDIGAAGKGKTPLRDGYREFSSVSILQTLGMNGKKSSKASDGNKSSIVDIDYGIADALEVACQVAQEVEREMTDRREPFCSSSSGRSSADEIMKSASPDSIERLVLEASPEETSTGESKSLEAEEDGSLAKSGDMGTEQNHQTVHAAETVQDQGGGTEKGFCGFDLNEEVCSEGCPDDTRQEKQQERHVSLDFDLNMVEEESFLVPSAESNPGRSEKLELDLNSAGEENDDDVVFLGSRMNHNSSSHCYASSSSSQFHHPRRNFDLNNQQFLYNDSPNQVPYRNPSPHGAIAFGRPKPNPFISIMGTRVAVHKEEASHVLPSYHSNGKKIQEQLEGGEGGLGIGSAVSSLYDPGVSFPSMYSRVAPVMAGASLVEELQVPPFSMPFMMNLGAGPSRPSMDLNLGFPDNGGSGEPHGFFRQFLPSPPEEHPGTFFQPLSGSMVGTKRKEPDGGWDLYPLSDGPLQFPWKQ